MLTGQYEHTLDSKRRLALPTKIREKLGPKVVLTRGIERCLFVYAVPEWVEFAKRWSALPLSQGGGRSFARLMLSGAVEQELDNLGRVLIPEYLKAYAELKKEIVVVGVFNRLEIWDKARWEKYRAEAEEHFEEIAEGLKEFNV